MSRKILKKVSQFSLAEKDASERSLRFGDPDEKVELLSAERDLEHSTPPFVGSWRWVLRLPVKTAREPK